MYMCVAFGSCIQQKGAAVGSKREESNSTVLVFTFLGKALMLSRLAMLGQK